MPAPTGVTAVFAGSDRATLTRAAAVLANELDRELYRVDLSRVVSKYIGETEKNLSCLYDAAESKGWVLFFDEADALFGKRTDVKDAYDRYANIEINYTCSSASRLSRASPSWRPIVNHRWTRPSSAASGMS